VSPLQLAELAVHIETVCGERINMRLDEPLSDTCPFATSRPFCPRPKCDVRCNRLFSWLSRLHFTSSNSPGFHVFSNHG
jgi:hypothetical protein